MKILIACGGTAGHIFPGMVLAEELKREDQSNQIVVVVSTHPRDRDYLQNFSSLLKELDIETVPTSPLPYKFSPKLISFAVRMFLAFLKSFAIILRYSPQVVVGFGGYASFAPVTIAHVMGVPVLIHEQNFIPGRANRLLAKVADRIAISFEETRKFLFRQELPQKVVKTGLPLRDDILTFATNRVTPVSEKLTLFVVGGSQGAHNINELVLDCLSLMDDEQRRRLRIIHLAGKRDLNYVKSRYAALDVEFSVFDFLEDIASAYKVADLLISRSGAGTIFEAASFGLVSLFIPHAYGTGHQKENALFLARQGAALVLDEENRDPQGLKEMLQRLMEDKSLYSNLAQNIKKLEVPGAAVNLKEQVYDLYKAQYVHR